MLIILKSNPGYLPSGCTRTILVAAASIPSKFHRYFFGSPTTYPDTTLLKNHQPGPGFRGNFFAKWRVNTCKNDAFCRGLPGSVFFGKKMSD